jgi:hypothetical protein
MRREAFVLLDGNWRFTLDVKDEGLKKKWFVKHNYTMTANFPGSIESYFAAVQDARAESDLYATSDEVIAWYERDFSVPEEWNNPDKLTQLTFGACGYETRVWLNGTCSKQSKARRCISASIILFHTSCRRSCSSRSTV